MDLEDRVMELEKKQSASEEQHRTIFRRLDKSEKLADSVSDLALSVRDLVNAQNNTDSKVDKLCVTVEEIKEKPGKRWETLCMDVLKVIVGGLIGYVLVKLGLG